MRGVCVALGATILAFSMTLVGPATTARAAGAYDSTYMFESAFLQLNPGDSGLFSVFFANTGTSTWVKGTSSQINLAVCSVDKVTCNTTSPNAGFAFGWLSPIAYATHQKEVVTPGDSSAFSYSISVPRGQPIGTYRFNGDLVLASTGERIRPEGYYHDVNVGIAPIALAVSPDFSANEDNEISAAVPGTGQHSYTFTTTLTGTLTFAILPANNVLQSGGSYSFCDRNQDRKADGVGSGTVFFTGVNGVSVGQSQILFNQPIPSNGQIRVTVDSAARDQVVRVVGWQDRNVNQGIDLTTAGADTNCNAYTAYDQANDGLIAVSGRKYYFGPQGTFGAQFGGACKPVFLHDPFNQVFSAGNDTGSSIRFRYKDSDIFRVTGTRVSLGQFKSQLNPSATGAGDTISVNYNPSFDGINEFNICNISGAAAPSNLTAATGNFDSGSAADDVRLTFTAPSTNATLSYLLQRATIGTTANGTNCRLGAAAPQTSDTAGSPVGSAFVTLGAVSVDQSKQGTLTNSDLADGGYCFRVLVQNPTLGLRSYSNYVPVNLPGATDTTAPRSTSTRLTLSSGFANTLDTGDKLTMDFTEPMSIAGNATIRVTDSDCGLATNAGPHSCSGGTTNSVADMICGTNATCVLQDGPGGTNATLVITLVANPATVSLGSTAGIQFPAVVTDVLGVTDLSGNVWNLSGSPDRLIQ